MSNLVCPVCKNVLHKSDRCFRCVSGHSFDIAKEGYVNLLTGSHKSGNLTGDSKAMAAARRSFLETGCFEPLKTAVGEYINSHAPSGAGVDICCGEGYYTGALRGCSEIYAFDLSKEMVRLAAKHGTAQCFVANISNIPLETESTAAAIHLFAPFHDREFARIMRRDGLLLTAVAGKRHLFSMKQVLYKSPYENDEEPPAAPSFEVADVLRIYNRVSVEGADRIAALLNMTPYGVHTPPDGKSRLTELDRLETEIEFVVFVMKKR